MPIPRIDVHAHFLTAITELAGVAPCALVMNADTA